MRTYARCLTFKQLEVMQKMVGKIWRAVVLSNKVGIIICYFGKLPPTVDLWLASCTRNPGFDFLIFTDQKIEICAANIHVYQYTLKDVAFLIMNKLHLDNIGLVAPYKLCDFKPMYGEIFEDYLLGYDSWGMCDMDMIFGDLSRFITTDILEKHDKIYQLGHLTLYRNNKEVNGRFRLDGYANWQEVAQTERHCKLCERGMMEKYRRAGLPVYDVRDYADISKIHRRYQLSHWLVPSIFKDRYQYQLFYCDFGRIFRAVYESGNVFVQEFNYIHLQKRKIHINPEGLGECYYITKNSFFPKKPGIPDVKDIVALNPYPGLVFELLECAEYEIKKRSGWLRKHWENRNK